MVGAMISVLYLLVCAAQSALPDAADERHSNGILLGFRVGTFALTH
jgi:hypothetical protein